MQIAENFPRLHDLARFPRLPYWTDSQRRNFQTLAAVGTLLGIGIIGVFMATKDRRNSSKEDTKADAQEAVDQAEPTRPEAYKTENAMQETPPPTKDSEEVQHGRPDAHDNTIVDQPTSLSEPTKL